MSKYNIIFNNGDIYKCNEEFIKELKSLDDVLFLYDDNNIQIPKDYALEDIKYIYKIYKHFNNKCKKNSYNLYDFYYYEEEIYKFTLTEFMNDDKLDKKIFKLLKFANYLDYELARDLLCYIISYINLESSVDNMLTLFEII
jgi:hypothetical protein